MQRLTQYFPVVLIQLYCDLVNEYKIMAAKEKHSQTKKKFWLRWRNLVGDYHQTARCSVQNRPKFHAKFQLNPFSSFGEDASKQNDTQNVTDTHTTRTYLSQTDRASAAHTICRVHLNNPVTLKVKGHSQGHWKWNHWINHTRLTITQVIWHWILSWPWNVG